MMVMIFVMKIMLVFIVFITWPVFECSLRWPWEARERFAWEEENSRPSGPNTSTLLNQRRSHSLKRPATIIWKHGLVVGDTNVNHPVSDSSVSDFPTLDFSLPACNT